jgi:hypothetical protein
MKKYIQFMEKKDYIFNTKINDFESCNSYYDDALGSDSIRYVDNRLNIDSICNLAYEIMEKNKKIREFKYFEIRSGDLNNYMVLYKNYN